MGATSKYALRWPAVGDFVKDGASAIKLLAQDVEAALLPPLLVTDGDGSPGWAGNKYAEVPWDVTDNPDRKRGAWKSPGNAERLVIPPVGGYYMVTASVRFGGKAEPDWYEVSLRSRQAGSDVGSGTTWATSRIELPDSSDTYTQLSVASIVRLPDTSPDTGVAVRIAYGGSTQPPDVGAGVNKLRVVRLCAL